MLSEIANYLSRIQDLHQQINQLIAAAPAAGLDWRAFGERDEHTANSLAVLAAHIAGAEHFWIGEVIGGLPPTRDRDAEFATHSTSADELIQLLDHTITETSAILSDLDSDAMDQTRNVRGKNVAVRWAIVHVIDHTALHLGHMQMTYQMLSKGTAHPAPLWDQRLPQGNG